MDNKLDKRLPHSCSKRRFWSKEKSKAVEWKETTNFGYLNQLSDRTHTLESRHAIIPYLSQQLLHIAVGDKLQPHTTKVLENAADARAESCMKQDQGRGGIEIFYTTHSFLAGNSRS